MMELLDPETRRNPYPYYRSMRESAPVRRLDGWGSWGVFRYDEVKRVLTEHETFSSGTSGGFSLIATDPPRHAELRALVSKAFTPKAVAALEPRIEAVTRELLDGVDPAEGFDVIGDFAGPLPVIVIAELLGIPTEDRERFKRWSDLVVASADVLVGGGSHGSYSAFMEMYAYFGGMIARRRREPLDGDLISALLMAEEAGVQLSEQDILSFCALLLVAGNETTTNLIGNAVRIWTEQPEVLERLAVEPGLLPGAIEEVLRYRSPVQAMFRTTKKEVELEGGRIPAGSRVVAFIGSANRDGGRFPDADRYDPARSPNPHIAFGHGIHFCLGAPLARLEARVALGALLERCPRISRLTEEPLPPVEGFIVHGVKRLPVVGKAGVLR